MLLKIVLIVGGLILAYFLLSLFSVLLFGFFNGIRSRMVNYVNHQEIKYGSWKLLFYSIFCYLLIAGDNVVAAYFSRIPILSETMVRLCGIVLGIIPFARMLVKSKLHFPLVLAVKVLGLPMDVITMALYFIAHMLGMETDEPEKDIIASEQRKIAQEEERIREYYRKHPVQNTRARRGARTYEVTVDGKTYQTYDNPDYNSRIHIDGEGFVDKVGDNEYTSSYSD